MQIAIKAWSRIIALFMEDSLDSESEPLLDFFCKKTETATTNQFNRSLKFESPSDMKKFIESAKRTPEWLKYASEKLSIFMSELDSLVSHSHFRVRKELATGISLLLTKCPRLVAILNKVLKFSFYNFSNTRIKIILLDIVLYRNMKPSFSKLIEILITLSEDESLEVEEIAKNGLNTVSIKCSEESGMRSLVELFEDNFYKLLTTLPRIMRTSGLVLFINLYF